MDVSLDRGNRLPALVAAVALLVLSASLIAGAWRNVNRLRGLVERHMSLSAQTMLRGAEVAFLRSLRLSGGSPVEPPDSVRDLIEAGDVRFVAMADGDGQLLFSLSGNDTAVDLPPGAAAEANRKGEWARLDDTANGGLFVLVKPARGARERQPSDRAGTAHGREHGGWMWQGPPLDDDGQARPLMMGPMMGQRRMPLLPPGTVAAIGIDAEPYLSEYRAFRRGAVYQTAFILIGAGLVFLLAVLFLNRREAGRELARLRRTHSELLDAMPDGLLALDGAGVVTAANPAAAALAGARELAGHPLAEAFPALEEAVRDCRGEGIWSEVRGGGLVLEVNCRTLPGEAGEARLVLVRDRTAVKQLEERLGSAERLAAVGRLAAGVAHEIRNPLTALRGFAQFFAGRFAGTAPEEEYARTMVREADRLNKVISGLLFLSRPQAVRPVAVDAAGAFAEIAALLQLDLAGKGVALVTEARAASVNADPDGLKQILLNLVMNALAAVPQGTGRIRMLAEPAEGGVAITVADNGPGFPPEARARAFEPFFTTRKEGTGLGLAIVHRLVEDHGGTIAIEDGGDGEDGTGGRVRIVLPG